MHQRLPFNFNPAIFFSVLAMYGALLFCFQFFMLDLFGSDSVERNWHTEGNKNIKELFAAVCALFVAFLASTCRKRASDFFFIVLCIFPVLPMIVIFHNRGAHGYFLVGCLLAVAVIWALIKIPPIIRKAHLKTGFISAENFIYGTLALGVLFVLYSVYSGGLSYFNINLDQVYEYRTSARNNRIAIFEYIATNSTTLLIPLSLALCLRKKSYMLAAGLFFLSFLIYGFTSHKSQLFIPVYAAFTYFCMRYGGSARYVQLLAVGIMMACFIYLLNSSLSLPGTYTIRRMFFVPAYLNFMYFDFFENAPFFYWADSRFTFGLVENPYGYKATGVIAAHFWGVGGTALQDIYSGDANANTGFLGSGFAQAGYAGIFVYAVVIAILIRMTNLIADKIGIVCTCAGFVQLFGGVIFSSTDTASIFLSYGAILLPVLAIVLLKMPEETAVDASGRKGRWPERRAATT